MTFSRVLTRAYGAERFFFNAIFLFLLSYVFYFTITPAHAEIRILALGDSLTAGYGLPDQESFTFQLEKKINETAETPVKIINGGVSGDTTAGGLSRVDWLLAENPQVAIVTLGGNDGLKGLSPDQSYKNLETIVTKLKDNNIPVLLSGMLAPPNLGADFSKEFNNNYPKLAEKHDLLFFPFFLEDVAGNLALNQADGIHPNAKGVEVIVKNITPYVEKLLSKVK
ncbi:MAG: arylesterase [Alphaproteobacteria bacterium]|nr:arylesterase [Alphaproteobacteria bacterium]